MESSVSDVVVDLFLMAVLGGVLLVTAALVAVAVAVALGLRVLRRANRVVAGERSAAPLRWLVSPGWAARLHRSLRSSARLARSAAGDNRSSTVSELAAELNQQAVLIDRQLVAAALLPIGARWSALGPLTRRTAAVRDAAQRLAGLAALAQRHAPNGGGPADLDRLSQRLDVLADAYAELDRLDATANLARS